MIVEIDPKRPKPKQIRQVVEALKRGDVIIYPTDTCYGFGADIFNKRAIEKVYQIKGIGKSQPFSFVCSDLSDISRYARVTDMAYRILKRYLPGPYTFVLEGSRQVPKMMLTKRKTAGIRIPDHPVCLEIVRELGNPIISTTVSRGDEVLSDPRQMAKLFGKQVAVIVDSGIILPEPSSVISLIDDEPVILRRGKGECGDFE
jgi:tRNA threonylcarbamoyl adenosine modification protein (Sua5/YciO/YrdC/YwlC family)